MDKIIIRGAKQNNLKNIDVEIPKNKLVVLTGLSGSGKSSLAFDTIYAEGQRRYVESLSSYARQFLGLMEKPDVESIEGLSPAISIDQRSAGSNPRSTVGTITEIADYLRLLYARIGTPHCPTCGKIIERQTAQQIVDQVGNLKEKSRIAICAPLIRGQKGEHRHILADLKRKGYVRMRVDNVIMDVSEKMELDKQKKHTIQAVIDRLVIEHEKDGSLSDRTRISDAVEQALRLSGGLVGIVDLNSGKQIKTYSELFACAECGISLEEITPRLFSFNSPHGACSACTGLGTRLEVDPDLVFPNPRLTLAEGAVRPWSKTTSRLTWYNRVLAEVGKKYGFSVNVPVNELSEDAKKIVLYGVGDETFYVKAEPGYFGKVREMAATYEGVVNNLERRYGESDSDYIKKEIEKFMRVRLCNVCGGKRLKPEALSVDLGGKNIWEVSSMPVARAKDFFEELEKNLSEKEMQVARLILKEIKERLSFLVNVGLDYLDLMRTGNSLSGGEAQRIRLATQIGSQLSGVLYILDEPSIGLHQRDNGQLIEALKHLRDLGNSVIVVEHDEQMIRSADHLIDIGPGAGEHGGEIIACGTPDEITNHPASITGAFLAGKRAIKRMAKNRQGNGKKITIVGAMENNLQNINVEIPLGKFICVTGVSGSGKSSLINDILVTALAARLHRAEDLPGKHKEILGVENIDKVIGIDQSPIGRTPRSNPATYTNVFTPIRELFAVLPEAKARGYKEGRFSFNVKGGRCENCKGDGVIKIEMHFLPDVYVTCEECKGKRYNREALEIIWKGKTVSDVLAMTVEEALEFFQNQPLVKQKLQLLADVGLGYIKLGQPATTLSGGEAQRVKLATELSRKSTGKTLYVLDEPTTGLHFADVEQLLNVLHRLVDKGNTVLVIEHNLDVIKTADWVIDLGPEGGDKGGKVIACGTPHEVAKVKNSYTGQFLKELI